LGFWPVVGFWGVVGFLGVVPVVGFLVGFSAIEITSFSVV
jgi:hypothetical protein